MEIGSVFQNQPAPSTALQATPEIKAERRELVQAVKALNATELFGQNNELTFAFDRDTRRQVVRIVDRETREVVRQIPPEYAIRMAEDLRLLG